MADDLREKMLIGEDAICTFLSVSGPTMRQFVGLGMPVRVHNKRLYAHKENISEWFKQFTRIQNREIPEDAE